MKNTYISLSFVLFSSLLMAQNKNTKSADKLFNRYEFVAASEAYLKLVDKNKADDYVYKQLADSYYNIFNTTEAAKWYAKATEEKEQDAETYYRYAQMLKANGSYSESDVQMRKFAALAPSDHRAIAFLNDPEYLQKLNNQAPLFSSKNMDINSEKSDFGAVLADNTLYLASARNKGGKIFNWNKEPFLDIYTANYAEDGSFSSPTAVAELNSKYNDGPVALSKDGNTMYFASESLRKNEFLKDKSKLAKYGQVHLYKATRVNGKWGNIEALPFNNKGYSCSNPSLSKDGSTLYFSSNMPGAIGATDIWKVAIDANGVFGTPVNLGPTVNTEGKESFPFISDDDKLYFSSDAHAGFGGYDVFVADLKTNEAAKNVGKPVNSEKDDFAFSYNKTKKIGFFASNRGGQDDIYIANQLCTLQLITKVVDAKTGALIPEASLAFLENNTKVIDNQKTNAEGIVTSKLACDKGYAIQVSKVGFEDTTQTVNINEEGGIVNLEIPLTPIDPIITEKEILLQEIYFEFDKSNITQLGATELDKLVKIMNENPTMEIAAKSHTDRRGENNYNMSLSERRARSTVQYVISKGISKDRISAKGYGESEPKVNCKPCSKEEFAKNRRSEFLIVKK